MKPRVTAVKILYQVLEKGQSLNAAILANLAKNSPESNLVKELCYGSLRWYFQLDKVIALLLPKALKAKDRDIHLLLLIGLYQILYLRVAEHAAVSETVEAARLLKKSWATKLINGLLRNFIRNKDELLKQVDKDEQAKFSHPAWLISAIREAWPEQWRTILASNNLRPPLCLRINLQQTSREKWLAEAGIEGRLSTISPAAIIIPPQDIKLLPGFSNGEFSVQDAGAQLAASLLELAPQQRILDACAAPGGKTTHIAELEPSLKEIIAIDNKAERLEQAQENWQRLNLPQKITWLVNDAAAVQEWWDGEAFDRILIDAPCSATGVIRRHPDIKILRRSSDVPALVEQQHALLNNLWQVLRPGGLLVYVTCSVLPAENSEVISKFLREHPEAKEKPLAVDWGIAQSPGRQLLPSDETDGFYYVCLEKV